MILEGLNVLQPARMRADGTSGCRQRLLRLLGLCRCRRRDVRDWYVHRFLALRDTAFRDPRSYFTRYADLSETRRSGRRSYVWDTINGPNLSLNIRPTRGRATAILRKSSDHRVEWVRIRKV